MEKSCKALIAFIVVVWALLFGIIFSFIHEIKYNNVPQEIEQIQIENFIPQENIIIEPEQKLSILEQSIAICKNEYAEKIAHAVLRESERQGIPIPVIYALIGTESDRTRTASITIEDSGYFNPKAKSSAQCRGLMQISQNALDDFNAFNKFEHNYSWDEMFEIDKNIEVGVWHFTRYIPSVGEDWVNLYIVYNTGYGNYSKDAPYWIYNDDSQRWEVHDAAWYYRNNKYPPKENSFLSDLVGFAPTKRFSTYLNMYIELFA